MKEYYIEILEFAIEFSSVSRKRFLNVDRAIAIIEMSLKYFIFGFYILKN